VARNYHTKVDFFFHECVTRQVAVVGQRDEIVWYHEVRNGQYHGGGATVPQKRELDGVRAAAMEVFNVLFDAPDIDPLLDAHVAARMPPPPAPRDDDDDRVIDDVFGMIEIGDRLEYASDVLYALDPERYRETALELRAGTPTPTEEGAPA
jgi:hypothetical protein